MSPFKSILTLAIAASLSATALRAQPRKNCAPRPAVLEKLAEVYGETRQSIGLGADNKVIEVFAAESGSWTILMTLPTGLSCVVAAGRSFENLAEELPPEGAPA